MRRTVSNTTIANPEALTPEMVRQALQSLRPIRLWPWQRCHVVIRTENHAKSWIMNYIKTESEELDTEFIDVAKYYTMHLLTYTEEVQLVFRLRTAGLEGWTEYGISASRIGEDFACWE
jgi:hypothetical protein